EVGTARAEPKGPLVVADRTVKLARVVERDGDTHVALRGEAKLAGSRRHGERELIRGEGLHRAVEPAVDSAEMDERSRAKTRVGDLALLHDVARGLERLSAGGELTMLDVQDATRMQQMGKLR